MTIFDAKMIAEGLDGYVTENEQIPASRPVSTSCRLRKWFGRKATDLITQEQIQAKVQSMEAYIEEQRQW